MALKIWTKAAIDEAKDLVESGDINLSERRKVFAKIAGRETTLDDQKLMIATMTEDDDDEEFVTNVQIVERGDYEITA